MKCERCGGSLLWDDGEFCINCGWRPSYAKKPPSLPYPTLKLRLKKGRSSHYQADIVTPQIADRPARFWKRWTPSELECLANYYYGLISVKRLAGRLHRTEDTIIKRAGYERILQKSNFYTARTLAQVLGVPTPKTIILWKKKGWLRGQRSEKSQSNNGLWWFIQNDVISCLRKRPWLVDLKFMEQHYFRAVVQKEWENDPWYTMEQAAPLLGMGKTALHKYIRQALLQVEKKPYLGSSYEESVIVRGSTIQAFLKQRSTIQSFLKQRRAIHSLTKSPSRV